MTKLHLNSKNPTFDLFLAHFPYFWEQKLFSQKMCCAQHHMVFWYHAKIQRDLMI